MALAYSKRAEPCPSPALLATDLKTKEDLRQAGLKRILQSLSHVERLSAVRVQLKQDQLDGFVVPLPTSILANMSAAMPSGSRG